MNNRNANATPICNKHRREFEALCDPALSTARRGGRLATAVAKTATKAADTVLVVAASTVNAPRTRRSWQAKLRSS